MNQQPRLYGVSHGNGNMGVSHMFADYYVKTSDPWRLARAAAVAEFKPEWWDKALDELHVDGEADYTISACLYEPLDAEPVEEEGMSYCDVNGAWHITEVFPEDEPREGVMVYPSLEEALSAEVLAKVND